eukprot:scaffold8251_cov135-Isochrysis_galbana.AAC.2
MSRLHEPLVKHEAPSAPSVSGWPRAFVNCQALRSNSAEAEVTSNNVGRRIFKRGRKPPPRLFRYTETSSGSALKLLHSPLKGKSRVMRT